MESTALFDGLGKILSPVGFTLDQEQPHMSGERFLMMKDKFVLVGKDRDEKKVIIKMANKLGGQKEIEHEKKTRDLLNSVVFANDNILFPRETFFGTEAGYMIWATEYINQEKVFVEHDLEEQFFLILRAFEEQEAFHATTFEHLKSIDKFFPIFHAKAYFDEFKKFKEAVSKLNDSLLNETLNKAESLLRSKEKNIEKYSKYLTHTDFVPHNFRVKGRTIYMLDLSAVHFGNKYEGWARFLNYMIIHNPELERLLVKYVKENRDREDYENLHAMRIYKLGFLLHFYATSLTKTEGDLKELTERRINFWHKIMKYMLEDKDIPQNLIEEYKGERDSLRSDEEKKRQREFAVA